MIRTASILSLLLLLTSCTVGQSALYSTANKKAIKYYEKALKCFNTIDPVSGRADLEGAEQYLTKSLQKDTMFSEAYGLVSQVFIEKGDIHNAILNKEKMINTSPYVDVLEYCFLAGMQMAIGDYSSCLKNAKTYKSSPLANERYLVNIDRMINNCVFALNAIKDSLPYKPVNLGPGVNTEMPEYFPSITADDSTLLFTRKIEDNRAPMGYKQEEIFVATKSKTGWVNSHLISDNINSEYNEGAPTFSTDGQYIIFVGCETGVRGDYDYGDGRKGFGSCDLFYSQNNGGVWSKPVNLGPPINSRHWETQPSFSSDGKTLYFVRGLTLKGQRRNPDDQDIFVTSITDEGTWSKPVRLSNTINTPFREESVQIHPDGKTLYFASNGHPGMGGLDIFMSRKQADGTWSKPENLGYPVNTFKNENSILISSDGKLGYFSSNRTGGYGNLDLYQFQLDQNFKPLPITFVKGIAYDAETTIPLPALFQLTEVVSGEIISTQNANPGNGEFLITLPNNVDLAFHAECNGYNLVSENFSMDKLRKTDDGLVLDVPMNRIKKGSIFILENIFFDFDKNDLLTSSITELNKLYEMLTKNPDIKIEIGGHTDNDGKDEYNLELSENRAKSVVGWLVNKGIDANRLSYKGYGEKYPIVENSSAENKAKNRRTEVTIK